MRTYCLVIDDDNQEEYFETNVYRILQKDHIELIPVFINPKARKYMKNDHSGFDLDLIEKDCIETINNYNCSVVVSDYQIATDNDGFTGLDILNTISENQHNLFSVLYSGVKIKEAIKRLSKALSDTVPDNQERMSEAQMLEALNQLKKISSINDIVSGKGYAETVIRYMRCSPLALQQQFLYQLKVDYNNMTFQSCYPVFKGWKLKDIGEQIEKQTLQGGDFQQALIEQTISYLIDINND